MSQSWHDSIWLFEQLAFAQQGDGILLIQDGVLALQSPITLASFVAKCEQLEISVMALEDDIRLRGVENQLSTVSLVNYAEFVNLVAQHDQQVAW